MKKVFLIFMAFLVCLACFNSMVGAQNRKYGESVDAIVGVLNKVGVASSLVLKLFSFNLADSDVLPGDYLRSYQLHHHELDSTGHTDACLRSLLDYYVNRFYSDVKIYYLQLGSNSFNNQFETQALGWYAAIFKSSKPELVEDIYNKAVEDGYSMNNPWIGSYADKFDSYDYSCSCEVK